MSKFYDEKYTNEDSFWGKLPSSMARIFFQQYLPNNNPKLLDIGCGEGRDSVFFAQNGCQVTGFDASEVGVKKSIALAKELNLQIHFFQADINQYRLDTEFEVIFSSGALHYIPLNLREEIIANYKQHSKAGGVHAHTVPVHKPFIPRDPTADSMEQDWRSGEILMYYHDWEIEFFAEEIQIDIKSGYKFPINRVIARKPNP